MNFARTLVSKKKKRFINETHKFNLDLSYVPTGQPVTKQEDSEGKTDPGFQPEQLIAMGFPSEGTEAAYRKATAHDGSVFGSSDASLKYTSYG